MINRGSTRLRNLLSLLLEDKRALLYATVLLVAQGIATAAAPRLLGIAVDCAEKSTLNTMLLIGVSYFLVELVRISSTRLQSIEFSKMGQGAVHRIRLQAFDHIMRLPWSEVRRMGSADLLSRLTVDIRSASALFEACFLRIIERLCTVFAIFVGIVSISPPVGLAVMSLCPLLLFAAWYTSHRLYAAFYERQAAFSAVSASLVDSIDLAAEVKLLGLSKKRGDHFSDQSQRLFAIQKVPPLIFGRLHAFMSVVTAIGIGATLVLGHHSIEGGLLTPGKLVTLIAYISSLMWPLILIIDQWSVLLQGLASVDRIFEILSVSSEDSRLISSAATEARDGNNSAVTFERVSFVYPETGRGIQNLSFSINAGERVGIVGATGSGKSTVSRLLLRLVTPDRGAIWVNGVALSSMTSEHLRETIGFMPQHPEIFSACPKDNVILWDPSPDSFEPVLQRLPLVIASLLNSPHDAVSSLSIGEKQFMAALRVLVRSPLIRIFDEPTASLDMALEQWLMTAIFRSSPEHTYLIIAHRISTLEKCDRILVLDDGVLVGEGSHQELLRENRVYRQLVEAGENG